MISWVRTRCPVSKLLLMALLWINIHIAKAHDMQDSMPTMHQDGVLNTPPPAVLRDPHAYADGYTLTTGDYVLSSGRRMHLADEQAFGALLFDRFEVTQSNGTDAGAYALQAWYGRDFNRLMVKADGDYSRGSIDKARTEVFWQHALAAFWDLQTGLRYDSGAGHERGWLAFGIEGLAPYWFDVNLTAYASDQGRAALLFESEYDLFLMQRLILQPRIEADVYSKDDVERNLGAGVANLAVGLRLRYEIRRKLAPYVGIEWRGAYAGTADHRRQNGESVAELQWLAGLRFWF